MTDLVRTVESEPREHAVHGAPEFSSEAARSLLRIVRAAQPISRADLARRLNVNRSTVTELVKPLVASGVISEAPPSQNGKARVGRPPVGLSLAAEGMFLVGVNVGVRRTQVAAATSRGDLIAEESFDTLLDSTATLGRVYGIIERLRASFPDRALFSIGLSVPGPTDSDRRRLLFAPHLGWQDVPVADLLRLSRRQGVVPVIVENDANAAAMHESRRRLREPNAGANDFILVRAGTGIGVGLVLGGEIYRGNGTAGGLLGEFGHMTIVAGGKACVCGSRGCWERYASASSASSLYAGDRVQLRGEKPPRFVEIVARAEAGELRARSTLAKIGEYLGIGISNVISGLGVPRVIVSGRIVHGWKFIEGPLAEALGGTMAGRLAKWSIEPGEPTGAGLGGALEVAMEYYLSTASAQIRVAA